MDIYLFITPVYIVYILSIALVIFCALYADHYILIVSATVLDTKRQQFFFSR